MPRSRSKGAGSQSQTQDKSGHSQRSSRSKNASGRRDEPGPSSHDVTSGTVEGDISFMDTEPMSFEEAAEGGGGGSDASSDTTCNEQMSPDEEADCQSFKEPTPRPRKAKPRRKQRSNSLGSCLTGIEMDDDDDLDLWSNSVDSPYDITHAPSHEVKRVYSELIDTCRGFENVIEDADAKKILQDNIVTGKTLLEQMEVSMLDETSNLSGSSSPRRRLGSQTSEMLMASTHTLLCAQMLNQKVKSIGTVTSTFQVSDFVKALREQSTVDGEYSYLLAARKFANMAGDISHTAPVCVSLHGTVDRDDLLQAKEPAPDPVPKEPKLRAQRTKNNDGISTQTEILKKSNKPSDKITNDTPEALAEIIRKLVKTQYKEKGKQPLNMLEVVSEDADDFHSLMTRILGVAFVVRDGQFEVKREEGAGEGENLSSLLLKPEKKRPESIADNLERSQTIVSFPASALKQLFSESNNS